MALGQYLKICRSWIFSCPICRKKQFAGRVSEYFCKWLDWVYRCEDFTFHFTSYFVQIQMTFTSQWYYTIFMWFFFWGGVHITRFITGIVNRLPWIYVCFNLCSLAHVYKWNLLEVEIFQYILSLFIFLSYSN